LRQIIHWKQLDNAMIKCNINRGANFYAFEYMKQHSGKYVRLKDIQDYSNQRTKEKTGSPLGDPSRPFELLRKDRLPLEWSEINYKNNKYVKYTPEKKLLICENILELHKHKNDSFNKNLIQQKLEASNYKCDITGINQDNGGLAADHFIPKEKGGKSTPENCVILNKILNEKKNNKMPIEWFCETLLTNFMKICKNVGLLEESKQKLIQFIKDF